MRDHEEIRQQIAAYALDALGAAERAAAERALIEHLPGCEECSAAMLEFREVAGALALGAAPRGAPEGLEARLLGTIRREAHPTVEPAPARGRAFRAAMVAAAVALGASAALNAALVARVDGLQDRERDLRRAMAVASDPRSRPVTLRGPDGSLVLSLRPDGKASLLGRIPGPPEGRVFELWLLRDGIPVAVTAFRPRNGIVALEVTVDGAGATGAAITVERAMVAAPTGAPLYAGTIASQRW